MRTTDKLKIKFSFKTLKNTLLDLFKPQINYFQIETGDIVIVQFHEKSYLTRGHIVRLGDKLQKAIPQCRVMVISGDINYGIIKKIDENAETN